VKFLVGCALLLVPILASADSIPTYDVTHLEIHYMDQLLFSGTGISGELITSGQVPMGSTAPFFAFGPTFVLDYYEMDIFAHTPNMAGGTVDRGNGLMPVSYSRGSSACGAGFPSLTQVVYSESTPPPAGTYITISATVTFCATIPMWDTNNPMGNPPDFYVFFDNLQGSGTYVLESMGQVDRGDGSDVTQYRWISLDYEANAVPEPATFVLCGLPLLLGGSKRFWAARRR
jgi:hypothetical protein